jgi:hypothetical protein
MESALEMERYQQYLRAADSLLEGVSKEELAECARLLAIHLAHYQTRYGEIPIEEFVGRWQAAEPNAKTNKLLAYGMQNFISILRLVADGSQKHLKDSR